MSDVKIEVKSRPVDVVYDRGRDWRARIGFVLIPTDGIIEGEMTQYAPPGVGMHFTRLPGSEDITVENLLEMEKGLEDAASRFVFDGDLLDVMCFAWTSASALIGAACVPAALTRGAPKAKPTSLITGVIKALRAFEVKRIVVGTPYLDSINTLEAEYLVKQGFKILDFQGMNILKDPDIRRVSPEFINNNATDNIAKTFPTIIDRKNRFRVRRIFRGGFRKRLILYLVFFLLDTHVIFP